LVTTTVSTDAVSCMVTVAVGSAVISITFVVAAASTDSVDDADSDTGEPIASAAEADAKAPPSTGTTE
jgi:hypothetical protein